MAAASDTIQTIARLTPLAEVLATVDSGREAGHAAHARRDRGGRAHARRRRRGAGAPERGAWPCWTAGRSPPIDTLGAGGYAPVLLVRSPQRVEAGQPMPPGTDSVAPFDAVKMTNGRAEALVTVNPGDGVLPAGGDCDPGIPLRHAGERLRITDLAAFAAAGIARVTVREPRIRVVPLRGSGIINAAARLVASDIERRGGAARLDDAGRDLGGVLAAESADAIVAIGGTGSGRNDASVQTLARAGRLAVHGIALTPGETAAFGFVGRKARCCCCRAGSTRRWRLAGGRAAHAGAAGAASMLKSSEPAEMLTLARKVASTVGLAEVVPVRRNGRQAEPLATKYLPLSALARSDGWILVPADSEGYSAGAPVQVRPWP